MAIAKVQGVTGNGATLVLNGVAAGNMLTLHSAFYRSTSTAAGETVPTDSNGTFAAAINPTPGTLSGGDIGASIFYEKNAASGTHTVTPENTTSHNRTLTEWSGADTTAPFDVSASGVTSATSHTSRTTGTTATTAQADEAVLIAHAMGASGGVADVGYTDPVSGFTTLQKVPNDASDIATFHAWQAIASAGTQSATFNWTQTEANLTSQAVIATFKAAAAGGFNAALMAAMFPQWPITVISQPRVVASGMTPPDNVPK